MGLLVGTPKLFNILMLPHPEQEYIGELRDSVCTNHVHFLMLFSQVMLLHCRSYFIFLPVLSNSKAIS